MASQVPLVDRARKASLVKRVDVAKRENVACAACGANAAPVVNLVKMVALVKRASWVRWASRVCLVKWDVKVRLVILAIQGEKDHQAIAECADSPEVLVWPAPMGQTANKVFAVPLASLVNRAVLGILVSLVILESMAYMASV